MGFVNDGLVNGIAGSLRLTGILLFGAWNDKYKQPRFVQNAAQENFYQELLRMIDHGQINEAENKMLSYIEDVVFREDTLSVNHKHGDLLVLNMALSVYGYMNDKEDSFLEKNDYCRSEIEDGIDGVLRWFGKSVFPTSG